MSPSSSLLSMKTHQLKELEDSAFNIITRLDKKARFLCSAINSYINNAQKHNNSKLVNRSNDIDLKQYMKMLRREGEVKEEKFRQTNSA